MEIMHEPSWYDKEQLPSLTSTPLVFFDEFHIQQVNGPPMTNKAKEHNIWFPRDEKGNIDVQNGKYDTKINQKRPPSSMNNKESSASV